MKPYDKYVDLVVSEILKFYTPDKEKGWMRSKKSPRIFFETVRDSKYPEWSLPSYKVENEMTKAIEDYADKAAIPEGADFVTLEEQRLYQEINNKLWDMTHPSSIVTEDNNNDKGRGALTAYYQIWTKGPTDSKLQFQDEFEYMNDLIKYLKAEMTEGKQVKVFMVWEDEDGNIVDREEDEILIYDDGMIKDLDHFLFGVRGPQETADMFGKKVYHPKKDKVYVPQRGEDEEVDFQEDLVNTEAPIEYKGFIIDKDKAGWWIVKYPDGAHLFEYKPGMTLSQVKADLTRSINKGEVNTHTVETIKEEYGYFKGTIPCDIIGEQLEYNSWSGYVDDEEWTLEINGFHQDDFFTMDVADFMTYDIAYPVKDGHLSYMGLDIIMYQSWLADTSADVDSIKHDLMLLCDDADAINKFLAGEVEELEFWVDYDVNFNMEAWEDSYYSDDEEDEEEIEEV